MPPLASTRFYISICEFFWDPESTGYAFLDTRKPWDLPLDVHLWGPESDGYAVLGHQKIKEFATGYAFGARSPLDMIFFGSGIQWICFFGAGSSRDFGARNRMDMLFWNTRKRRDLALDMLFWGP